jgi:hypothetical protein
MQGRAVEDLEGEAEGEAEVVGPEGDVEERSL